LYSPLDERAVGGLWWSSDIAAAVAFLRLNNLSHSLLSFVCCSIALMLFSLKAPLRSERRFQFANVKAPRAGLDRRRVLGGGLRHCRRPLSPSVGPE
jgi:hypothetical protein